MDEKDQPVDKDYDTVLTTVQKKSNTMVRHMNWYQQVDHSRSSWIEQGHLSSDANRQSYQIGRCYLHLQNLKKQTKQPMGKVTVHYVDTDGNIIKASVIDEKDQPVGKDQYTKL